jgi:hypothetical protein
MMIPPSGVRVWLATGATDMRRSGPAALVAIMAAPSYVFTIARVARMLGEDENTIYEIALDMEPEDGCLTVLDVDDVSTVAFTERGVDNLKELLDDLAPENSIHWRPHRRG